MCAQQLRLSQLQREAEEEEARIVSELERRKMEKLRNQKIVQKVREESEELRELELKLKNAYISMERAGQLEEGKQRAQAERVCGIAWVG